MTIYRMSDEAIEAVKETRFAPVRWFCDDSELIHSNGQTYALSNQWGPRGEQAMCEFIAHFKPAHITLERTS
jgi:hypothetical protein